LTLNLARLSSEDFCYLTTFGRVSGRPHEIEIWFALSDDTVYMLSGGRDRADWVKNLRRKPEVEVRIAGRRFEGEARIVQDPDEDELVRKLLVEKYERTPGSLANWRRNALPVAVDLTISD
jgi:deazaflavin-dependent oxidoreductase (nitroreductase family)